MDRDKHPAVSPRDSLSRVPWRTEGLPARRSEPGRRGRWWRVLLLIVLYVAVFGALSLQDQQSRPQPVPYTEFKTQVRENNIAEIFAKAKPSRGASATKHPFRAATAKATASSQPNVRSLPRTTCWASLNKTTPRPGPHRSLMNAAC
ncbi:MULTISPECIES: ATP-dependent metallopeptidase FtsH/Yme1/Tma family protein [Pseudarthrobacter]|uniref:ATP-dependent metallopeptidase FtsH/Yme1/Tma family protein n=1 Tax=Pseudarthrobacter TaxID=1742993 RepID=UPI0035303A1B